MVTASKVESANGRRIPSPATLGTLRSSPAASITREKAHATHHAPDLDSSTVDTAVPAAKSRTFSPDLRFNRCRVSLRHRRSWPKERTVLVMSYFSPTASNIDATSKGFLLRSAFLPTQHSLSYARTKSSRSPPWKLRTLAQNSQRNLTRGLEHFLVIAHELTAQCLPRLIFDGRTST